MRSRSFPWLLANDGRELLTSRAYWLLLLAMGFLAGHAFLTAVDSYAEMSGAGGGPAALAEGLSPLDGILVPVLGTIALAATLLLPFVVIRLVAREKQSGAWKLLAQGPASALLQLVSKLGVLLLGWLVAWIPALLALLLWRGGGNHLDAKETLSVLLGHALFAWLTIGVAAAAAGIMESEASAAVVALGFTIGTWALDLVGAARGGLAGKLAAYSPTAALRSFEQGLLSAASLMVLLLAGFAGLVLAALWLAPGRRRSARCWSSAAVLVITAGMAVGASRLRATWDLSENHRNSFPAADASALGTIHEPLAVEVHLGFEDPRLADLRTGILDKLGRVLPSVRVTYVAQSRTGMFERGGGHYGEAWYQLGTHRAMTRSTTAPIVLGMLYELAGITPPPVTESAYRGYPLQHRPRHLGVIFFVGWPLLIIAAALWHHSKAARSG